MIDGFAPRSLEEALQLRAVRPEAVPIAGGTDLMVAVNAGRRRPAALLDLSHVEELQEWRRHDGRMSVGAGVTFARIARELRDFAPLAEAARSVGSAQIRNRGTIGGNLATASPAGDSIPVLAAYDADVVLAAPGRERRLSWRDFLLGPKQTSLGPDELVVRVEWQVVDAPGAFAKVGSRNAMVIAIAGLCLQLDLRARAVRIALGSVAPTVVRAPDAESLAAELVPWDDPERPLPAATADVGRLAAAAASPIDDVRGTAAYRRHAVDVLARRALTRAVDEWKGAAC